MNKNYIKKYFDNPNYIQGIYNYCDRWCKKCDLTTRCMHYALSEDHFSDPDSKNITNKAFWLKISELFKVTLEMLNDLIEQEDIDMNMFDTKKALVEFDKKKDEAKHNDCSIMANDYIDMVNKWFSDAEELFAESDDILNMNSDFELKKDVVIKHVNELKDNLEIIQWYQYQIYIKVNRAIEEMLTNPPELNNEQSGYNGCAKVSLLGIDRSLYAWEYLMFKFPEREDEILNILIHLGRLRKRIEAEFPNARTFLRPGFDQEAKNVIEDYRE